ncbi:MAG: hypothetical protein ACHQQP_05395 [Gemmatimonadales bacterium]
MSNRSETVQIRDVVIEHLHRRASLEDVRVAVLQASRSMRADGMSMEEILVALKGGVTLAAEHVNRPSVPEIAASLRAQVTPWLISIYMNESGEFGEPGEE